MKKILSFDEAVKMLPDRDAVHTLSNPNGMLIGADWSRKRLLDAMALHGVELSGPEATRMGHGLAMFDGNRHIFIETKE